MRIVVALGGNALLRRGEAPEADALRGNVAVAADAVAGLADGNEIVVTHGNGPQIGLLALQAEAYDGVAPYPLDILGAESEGMIGYLIDRALRSRLKDRHVATLLTQVEVDPGDPAFAHPTKPIGPIYDEPTARRIAAERGWTVAPDGDSFRRVVPSPTPVRILEIDTIRLLLDAGVLTVCAGGGGISVALSPEGAVRGVEAVIDKDRAAALLGREIAAEALLLLTDVDGVYADWGTNAARRIVAGAPDELRAIWFDPGSMGPKVEAACDFVDATGGFAAIGALDQAAALLACAAGTRVAPDEPLRIA